MVARGSAVVVEGGADDEREASLAAEHVAGLRHLRHELVHGAEDEARHGEIEHGPQPGHRGAGAHPDRGSLGEGQIADPRRAEPVEGTLGRAENVRPQVLAHQDDPLVALHFLGLGLIDRLQKPELPRSLLVGGRCVHDLGSSSA